MKFLESTTARPSVNAAAILGFGDRRCLSQDHRQRQGNMHQEQVHRHENAKKIDLEKWARNRLGVRKSWQKLKYFTVTSVPFGATFGDLVVVDDINMNKCFFNP